MKYSQVFALQAKATDINKDESYIPIVSKLLINNHSVWSHPHVLK